MPEVAFRRIPDESGDSCTFLSWFFQPKKLPGPLLLK